MNWIKQYLWRCTPGVSFKYAIHSCCTIFCTYISRWLNTSLSKCRIRCSNARNSLGTVNASNLSFDIGWIMNKPCNMRTRDNTTYTQFEIHDYDTTMNLSFDIPCSLCPVVASFIFLYIWVISTHFNTVRSVTLSSKDTVTVAVIFSGESLKQRAFLFCLKIAIQFYQLRWPFTIFLFVTSIFFL